MKFIIPVLLLFILSSGCSKMEEKKVTDSNKSKETESSKSKETEGNNSQGQSDDKAPVLVKEADDALNKYNLEKSDESRKAAISNCMAAANYLMFDANLPAKEKYRPALKYFRKVLELDPKNEEATKNKKQIEDIYESMGMPIPQ